MNFVHGHSAGGKQSKTYMSWARIHRKCYDPSYVQYKDYGGRGIKVCDRWETFIRFLEDMGDRPDGHSLGRIDNDGNYEPLNCRWETQSQQGGNRRSSIRINVEEATYCAAEIATIVGMDQRALQQKMRRSGYDPLVAHHQIELLLERAYRGIK